MSKPNPRRTLTNRIVHAHRGASAFHEVLESRLMLSAVPAPNALMTPMYLAATGQTASPAVSPTPPDGSTTPAQMRRFYSADNINFNGVPGDGRGMTIAVVDAYNYATAPTDLQSFDAYYNLPDPPSFQILNQIGQAGNYPQSDAVGGWGIESALDVEWAHSMAPLANITLVEADSAWTTDLFQAVLTAANLPNVVCVSMSFGTPDGSASADNDFLTPSGHSGVTFLAATGDKGTPGTYPAFSPNVVAVGGTGITYAPDGTYISESAWSGTGGGTSTVELRPSYQSSVNSSAFRTIPDISMDAQPSTGVAIYDAYDHGATTPWAKYGGTSLATPMFAGLVAIADQGRVSIGQTRLDGRTQLLPALYSLGQSNYHDVIGGASLNGATAVAGYDLATGIGTPIANMLLNQLAGSASIVPQFTGSSPGDNFNLKLDLNHLYVDWTDGVVNGQTAVVDLNGLTLNGTGAKNTITLNYINGNPLPNDLKLNGTFTLEGLQGANPLVGKLIDLNRSKLYIDYASGPDPLSSIQQYLANGYNNTLWNGQPTLSSGVITSLAAATSAKHNTSVGYIDAADGTGYNTVPDTIEVAYTLAGDANLDGSVDNTDYNDLAANYKQPGSYVWDQGSFDYSGAVTFTSFAMIAANFNTNLGAQVVPGDSIGAGSTSGASSGSTTVSDVPVVAPAPTVSAAAGATTTSASATSTSVGVTAITIVSPPTPPAADSTKSVATPPVTVAPVLTQTPPAPALAHAPRHPDSHFHTILFVAPLKTPGVGSADNSPGSTGDSDKHRKRR